MYLQTDFIGRHESSYKMHYAKIEMNRIGKNRKEKKERISKEEKKSRRLGKENIMRGGSRRRKEREGEGKI